MFLCASLKSQQRGHKESRINKSVLFDAIKEITPPGGKFGDRLPDEVIIHALRPAGPL